MGIRIRLGYVANAMRLEDCSPSRTTTVAAVSRLPDRSVVLGRLEHLARANLQNTLRILKANVCEGIEVYRLTSKLVPLATHPLAEGWDFAAVLAAELREVGAFAREHGLRLSAHPDHFTLLNSPRSRVLLASLRDLAYHEAVLSGMDLSQARLVMHVGGGYEDREEAGRRFLDNLALLPAETRRRLALENDDRSFHAGKVLEICRSAGCPMVLDAHHDQILPGPVPLGEILPAILGTWGDERPKLHYSSPRSPANPRSHADYIEPDPFVSFIRSLAVLERDLDIMLEAKAKDLALLRLGEEIDGRPGIKRLNPGELSVDP